jgi:Holliday junction resolvase
MDRSAAGRHARNKGGRAEAEVVKMAHAHGFTEARRNFGSGSRGGLDIIGIPATSMEVKRKERCSIWEWIGQLVRDARPTDIPVLAFRRNNSDWWAAIPLDDYFALLAARENS